MKKKTKIIRDIIISDSDISSLIMKSFACITVVAAAVMIYLGIFIYPTNAAIESGYTDLLSAISTLKMALIKSAVTIAPMAIIIGILESANDDWDKPYGMSLGDVLRWLGILK